MMFDLGDYLVIGVHGGADSGGGLAGGVAGILSFIEGLLQQPPSESFRVLMPGLAELRNVHPLFVHFPIALLSLFFLLDAVGSLVGRNDWRRVAGWFLYLGTVFAAFTVVAGLMAAKTVAHGGNVHEIMEHHEHLGLSVLSLAGVLAVWRWLAGGHVVGAANHLYLLLAAVLSGLVAFTADLGGLMVYKHGVAVVAADAANEAAAREHQHEASDAGAPIENAPVPHVDVAPVPSQPDQQLDKPVTPKADAHTHGHHDHNHQHSH